MSIKRNHVQDKVIQGRLIAHRETNKVRRNMTLEVKETKGPASEQGLIKRKHEDQKKEKPVQERLRTWKKRRNMEEKDANTIIPAFEPCTNVLKIANEDMLFEIIVRLPEYRSVVLCGAVCHQWHSVISQPKFVPSFIRHHNKEVCSNSRPYAVIFFRADITTITSIEHCQPFLSLHSQESKFLHKNSPYNWDFMPSGMMIRASLDDLLLVSPGRRSDYYICNPISRQWIQLPKSEGPKPCGFALVRKLDHYKVVLIHYPFHPMEGIPTTTAGARVFCSLSGKWTLSKFSYPPPKELWHNDQFDVVTRNGVLYWLETAKYTFDRVLFFDVLNDQWGIIDFPVDLVVRRRRQGDSYGKVYLGLVCGEIWLVQIVKRYKSCYAIKMWELHSDTACWILIKETNLTRPNTKKLRGFAVHPNDVDLVFMIWGRHAFEHRITTDTCSKVGNLPFSIKEIDRVVSIPILHPPVPTPVPLLPECASGPIPSFFDY